MAYEEFVGTFITSILTSSIVSILAVVCIKLWIEKKIEAYYESELRKLDQRNNLELEEFKAELLVRTEATKEINEVRYKEYPKLLELIYRIRNQSRKIRDDLSKNKTFSDDSFELLHSKATDLEDELYCLKFYLEKDSLFVHIHNFKNYTLHFLLLLKDYRILENNIDKNDEIEKIIEIFNLINEKYMTVTDEFNKIGVIFEKKGELIT